MSLDAGSDLFKAVRAALLADTYRKAVAMADAIRLHPLAGPLIDAAPMEHRELSGWWTDDDTGVRCRVRFDAVADVSGQVVVVDAKTAAKAGKKVCVQRSDGDGIFYGAEK